MHPEPSTSTQLHRSPPAHFNLNLASSTSSQLIWASTQLPATPPTLFEPQYRTYQAISPNLGQKIEGCLFCLKIDISGNSEVLIPNPDLLFWNSDPKSILSKFGPKKSKLSVSPENWYTWYLEDVGSYSNVSFLNLLR